MELILQIVIIEQECYNLTDSSKRLTAFVIINLFMRRVREYSA